MQVRSQRFTAALCFSNDCLVAVFGFTILHEHHDENKCDTLLRCFVSYLTGGISGDGIGAAFKEFDNPQSLFGEASLWLLTLLNQTYLLAVVVILLSVSTGIIIDSFGQLRDDQSEALSTLEGECFICSQTQFVIQQYESFDSHVEKEHNVWDYLELFKRLRTTEHRELTDIERHIVACLHQGSTKWIPIGRAMCIHAAAEQNTTDAITELKNSMEARLNLFDSRLDAMERLLRASLHIDTHR